MIEACGDNLEKVQKVLADGGYTGEKFAGKVKERLGTEGEIARRNELHRFAVIPKRWGETFLRLAGEAPPPLAKLRTQATHLPPNVQTRLHQNPS
jgi:transposase